MSVVFQRSVERFVETCEPWWKLNCENASSAVFDQLFIQSASKLRKPRDQQAKNGCHGRRCLCRTPVNSFSQPFLQPNPPWLPSKSSTLHRKAHKTIWIKMGRTRLNTSSTPYKSLPCRCITSNSTIPQRIRRTNARKLGYVPFPNLLRRYYPLPPSFSHPPTLFTHPRNVSLRWGRHPFRPYRHFTIRYKSYNNRGKWIFKKENRAFSLSREDSISLAITEPMAGSDVSMISTSARDDPSDPLHYHLAI